MSRVGKKPITVPATVKLEFEGQTIRAKGPKGQLEVCISEGISFSFEGGILTFSRANEEKQLRAKHGLSRALTSNIIEGVSTGFTKVLKIEGVGYKSEMKGSNLMLSLGFSHPVLIVPPDGIQLSIPSPNTINVAGIDKQLIGEVAATIRKLRPPEPYKGKGVRYIDEYIRRKAGKTASK